VPLFGYRRKSWFVVMALLALAFWSVAALLAATGVRVPALYLLAFNLAFATYAFVDVVCDALMVETGRRLKRVGAFVNFQWTVLACANAAALFLGGWFQSEIQQGALSYWTVFLVTGLPPLATAFVGWRYIDEERVAPRRAPRRRPSLRRFAAQVLGVPRRAVALVRNNRTIGMLVLFIFFWKFSPSVGFIERSYLIDERGFSPTSFGTILAVGGITFLVSILAYRWVVARFRGVDWHDYLYAMIAIGVLAFPLSFFLYLDPDHAWWRVFTFAEEWPAWLNPLPDWNRYEWFRLVVETVLGFATIPAFIIPLTLAGETVKVHYAGVGYAFLMSFANVTNVFEGVVGAGLYRLFSLPALAPLLRAFEATWLNVADTADERTLILQIFVYIGLGFTLLTIPFVVLLRRELASAGVEVKLHQ